ncbi:preprotein translocase subunit SecG [candidate division WWE3 bacterium CG_4_9_14_0_2_um_filter_35_11]|uniref:Protein-export membrane protein SecG n=1 Tax=candidate division WWE3 bacterium CG_4_9_14_0_2_um_filter_35_11 TaxID=1975077 RepID=A0A2M8EMA9_UNCKA|nr:MAG: preprotein translocase subunit SecG [candidate division WWE3 bacterium CG10_big_fil_rev_8_21_14_0_10_35_32]PJC23872.1 MAG: preprotein translocase subunit SecG [candidate division WWE3 bacterium CG_4_9_14_0_2_um_filter_35_11]
MQIVGILNTIQILASIVIIVLVLIQQHESGIYSKTSNINRSRRGTEKVVYNLTIVFGTIFVIASIANFLTQ